MWHADWKQQLNVYQRQIWNNNSECFRCGCFEHFEWLLFVCLHVHVPHHIENNFDLKRATRRKKNCLFSNGKIHEIQFSFCCRMGLISKNWCRPTVTTDRNALCTICSRIFRHLHAKQVWLVLFEEIFLSFSGFCADKKLLNLSTAGRTISFSHIRSW